MNECLYMTSLPIMYLKLNLEWMVISNWYNNDIVEIREYVEIANMRIENRKIANCYFFFNLWQN